MCVCGVSLRNKSFVKANRAKGARVCKPNETTVIYAKESSGRERKEEERGSTATRQGNDTVQKRQNM